MKIFLLIGWSLISVCVFGQIRTSNPVRNLGDIFEKSGKVTTKFELKNPYREDTIRIVDITTSCGCTAALLHDTLILPLSTVELDVTYDPAGRLGLFVKSIELTTKTGPHEINKLFLKITGNVVAENFKAQKNNPELIEYKVAPIYFYPITAYDTSYFDFNYIGDFINDLTYEIDFYQFTTVGVSVEIANYNELEKMENLLLYLQRKLNREFQKRGFSENTVFIDEPIFIQAQDLPVWAGASIRLFSVNFDAESSAESSIRVTANKRIKEAKILLDYERFALPEITEIVNEVNFETIEGKLFLAGEMDLRGMILMPWKKSDKVRQKTAEELTKAIQKKIRETTGAGKKDVRILFDSLGIHPEDKFRFVLWDEADQEEMESFRYEVKPDIIVPPLLPTYRQYYGNSTFEIDTQSVAFKHFWENCILNYRAGNSIEICVEACTAGEVSSTDQVVQLATQVMEALRLKFEQETGANVLNTSMKPHVHSIVPKTLKTNTFKSDSTYNYVNLIPIVHNQPNLVIEPTKPYMVNFDYYFNGVDTGAWGFQRFANYLAAAVKKDGFVELRIESSISRIPMDKKMSNLYLAYTRMLESERRIKQALEKRLVDPNRIIFIDEHVVEQGPEYDGKTPIIKFKNFQYLRVVPEQTLK